MARAPSSSDPTPAPRLLVERDREVAALGAALAEPGCLLVVEGPPGVGKSALVARAREMAQAAGMVVLSATATELDRQVAFGVASQLFGPILAGAGSEERAALLEGAASPAAALFAHRPASAGNAFDNGESLIQGLYWLTENLAGRPDEAQEPPPLLVAVDDAHWSDETSLRFLARLVSRLPEIASVVVVALRSAEGGSVPALDYLRAHPRAQVLRPGPLGEAGVEALVRSHFPQAETDFVRACSRASGGNPFFLGTLLEALADEGVQPTAEAAASVGQLVPRAAVRSVLVRLRRLPEAAVSLARALAVLGDRTPLARAAALAGLEVGAAEDAADALAAAHLLCPGDPLSFTHPLIGSAVEADLPAFGRSRAHRRAAELLAESGAAGGLVAAHLCACRPQGDPWVVEVLLEAAQRASATGEHRGAAVLLTRAMEEPPGEAERPSVRVALALAQAAGGEPGSDQRLAMALSLVEDPGERADALLTLAQLLIGRGRFGAAAEVAQGALAELEPHDPLAKRLLNVFLMASSRHPPRRADALRRFQPLVSEARAGRFPEDPILCARLASRMATAGESPERVAALARVALAGHPLVDPTTHGIPFAFVAAGIYWTGDFSWCQQAADAALGAARKQGSPLALMAASHWLAAASRQLGQLDQAVVHADLALSIRRDGWDALVSWTGAVLAVTHLERGDLPAAHSALALAETGDPESLDWAFVLAARGSLALAEGAPAAARVDLEAAGRHLAERYRIDHPAVLPWRSMAALATARLGRAAEAVALAQEELDLARKVGLPGPLGRALRVAALVSGGPDAPVLLEEAIAVLRPSQAALAHAHALVELGTALRRSGRPAASREPLGEGLHLAESFGAEPLRSRAEQELRAAGGRRRSRAASPSGTTLTPTQHRVAQLATQGLTNPQIAQRLYVTTKTVEWHLGQVYRALGIASRRELPAVWARPGALSPR